MSALRFVFPLTLAFALPVASAEAQDPAKPPPARVEAQGQPAKETWVVAKIGDQFRVMKASEVEATRKKLEADHKAAVARHQEAVKAAEARGTKLDQPVPAAQTLTVVASDLKSADEAAAQMKKLHQEAKEKADKEKADKEKADKEKAKGGAGATDPKKGDKGK